MKARGTPPPEPENVFVARWRDRLPLAVKDDEGAAKFARYMASVADKIDVILRPEFGHLCTGSRWNR